MTINAISVLDLISTISFSVALGILLLKVKDKTMARQSIWSLGLSFLVYILVGFSNILEHAEITSYFDSYEDHLEIIFIPLFLYFLYSFYAGDELVQLQKADEALKDALAESRQRQTEISALLQSSHSILESPDFKEAARLIFDSCKSLIGATAGYVAMLAPGSKENEVIFLDSGKLPCTVDPDLPMPVRGLRATAYQAKKVVYDNDFANSEWEKFMPKGHARLENVLFAPLLLKEQAVGLLGLGNKPGGFNENDTRLAAAFAELAAIALKNSQTLESLEKSEERYRSVIQTATDAIITADKSGNIVSWNQAAEKIFGYQAEDMLAKPVTAIMPERYIEAHRKGFSHAVTTDETKIISKTVELAGKRKDGTEFPLELSLAKWFTGEELYFTGIIREITDRKNAEEEIEKLAKFPGENPYPVLRIAGDGTVLYKNQASAPLFDPSNGQTESLFISNCNKNLKVALKTGQRQIMDFECRDQTYSLTFAPVTESNYVNIYAMDITERKKAEGALQQAKEELEQQNEELKALDKMKDSLMRDVTHELKTPIAKINMQKDLLKMMLLEQGMSEKISHTIETMESSIKRQESVIHNILDLSRLEAGGRKFKREPTHVAQIINNALDDYYSMMTARDVLLEKDVKDVTISSDPELLFHVFSNLINNAIKYRSLTKKPKITISLARVGDKALIKFIDNGIGMTEGEVRQAFDKFYQASASAEGTGVGLSICKLIIEGLSGSISLESNGKDQGLAVIIELPIKTD